MTSDKKNIDILFKNGLAAFRESPPADAWKKLEHDLNKEKAVFFRYYFRWIAASILILVAFGAGYFYASFNLQDPQIVMEEKAKEQPAINNLIDYSSDDDAEKHSLNSKLSEEPDVNMTAKEVSSSVQNPIQIRSEIALNDLDDQNPINEEFGKKRNIINSEKERSSESEIVNPLASNEMLLKDQKNSDEDGNISKEFKNSEQTDNLRALVINHEDDLYLPGTEKHARSKLSVGVQFAPVYSYRDISINYENQSQNNTNEVESQYNHAEDALMTYAGGIDLNYSLNSRWALQSGVYYSKIGQINNDALNFVQDNDQYLLFAINTSTGNINVAFEKIPDDIRKINPPKDTLESVDIDNVRVVQNFNLLEVPFLIKYNLLNKKLGVSVLGGICPAYVVKNRTYLHVDKEKYDIGNSDNLNTMIYSSTFGIGFNYAISKALLLNFEPVFKYSLSPINKNSQFDYHPYSFSWLTGISYNF